jgi:DNA-directed RNA polymerase subunit RPC12/RpoP
LINNVETFANIAPIIDKGGEWFGQIGTAKSAGTKVFALAGKINNSGLIEVPMGTSLREIIFDIGGGIPGGKAFKAAQTGGPSGGCIPAEHLDTPMDYESLRALGSIMGSGGLIVMDFIDMKERRHRNAVYEKMVELMSDDKAKTHILPISQLGIMQMTRQRQQESLSSNLYTDCPYCRGRGIVKSATTMSVELQRKLSSIVRRLIARNDGKEYSLRVLVHPSILERLRSEDADLLVRMEKMYGVKLAFRADLNYHVENFKIINAITGEEYR